LHRCDEMIRLAGPSSGSSAPSTIMIAFRSFPYTFERGLTVRLNGRMGRVNFRAAMGPGSRNLKLAGETEGPPRGQIRRREW
jgi:hypothetical protein